MMEAWASCFEHGSGLCPPFQPELRRPERLIEHWLLLVVPVGLPKVCWENWEGVLGRGRR